MKRALFRKALSGGIALACLVTAASCSNADSTDGDTASTTATTSGSPKSIFDGVVALKNGRQLRTRCLGRGGPTVLLEAGGSSDLTDWSSDFVNRVAMKTTTCLYSRAGGAGSSPLAGPLTRAQVLDDANGLLESLKSSHGVNGPYVLVGWSFGGSVVLAEALANPSSTAGMVILDTDFPADFIANCRAAGRTAADCKNDYDEDQEAKSVEMDIRSQVHPLTGIPIAVVSALDLPDCHLDPGESEVVAEIGGTNVTAADCKALGVAIADKMRADWSTLGPQVAHTTVMADHDSLTDQAAAQLAAIVLKMVDAVR